MGAVEARYAEALLSLSQTSGDADAAEAALLALGRLYSRSAELRGFLLNPAVAARVRAETLLLALGANEPTDDCDSLLARFLRLLADKGRLGLLPAIADEYQKAKARHRNLLRVVIRSAERLDDKTVGVLLEKYRRQYGAAAAEAENIVDASLLGGICVQIGDTRIDDTLKGRFAELSKLLSAAVTS
ncbi:MAG: ATP synthase F1 subunit delta [Clostridiales bacterium]|jgi:ATP synthase F1 delta subunit|nr:ATP synthase F1 subunit delta [Clostridiales bacterium]